MVSPLKTQALERDHSKCVRVKEGGHICGRTERLTMHHLVPKRMGGEDDLDNVVIWCHECHRKYNKDENARKRRLHDVRKCSKWTVEWACRPAGEKCEHCHTYACTNWPEGFVEALWRLLSGMWAEPQKN